MGALGGFFSPLFVVGVFSWNEGLMEREGFFVIAVFV